MIKHIALTALLAVAAMDGATAEQALTPNTLRVTEHEARPKTSIARTISKVDGSLEIRLKHFDARLRGWEEQEADAAIVFPLIARRDGRIYFDAMTFEPRADALTVYLAIEDRKGGAVREEIFTYRRVK